MATVRLPFAVSTELADRSGGAPSAVMRERVDRARQVQRERLRDELHRFLQHFQGFFGQYGIEAEFDGRRLSGKFSFLESGKTPVGVQLA